MIVELIICHKTRYLSKYLLSNTINDVCYSDLIPTGVRISGLTEVSRADIVIVAIPFEFYPSLPVSLLAGKTVVDVSNRSTSKRTSELSQAEHLAQLLPHSKVVKSFNVLSAYSLGRLSGCCLTTFAYNTHYCSK